jgi:hypothetical protein
MLGIILFYAMGLKEKASEIKELRLKSIKSSFLCRYLD